MATLYLTTFGMIISIADSVIYFTKMWQKDKLVVLNGVYFLVFFITGIVAIAGTSDHATNL